MLKCREREREKSGFAERNFRIFLRNYSVKNGKKHEILLYVFTVIDFTMKNREMIIDRERFFSSSIHCAKLSIRVRGFIVLLSAYQANRICDVDNLHNIRTLADRVNNYG